MQAFSRLGIVVVRRTVECDVIAVVASVVSLREIEVCLMKFCLVQVEILPYAINLLQSHLAMDGETSQA